MEKIGATFTGFDYERIRQGCQESADVIVPLLIDAAEPSTVVDVGCGEGWFGGRFAAFGIGVTGIDYERPAVCAIDDFVEADLAFPTVIPKAELAVCLETVEHLPPERGPGLVEELCAAAPIVAFSAAIPKQGGHGHINERWPSYWAALFAERGYRPDSRIREQIWDDTRVEPWYRQNLLVFYSTDIRPVFPSWTPLDIVHPEIFGWKVNP